MRGAATIVEALHGIGGDVRLGIEIVDPMAGRPGGAAVLQRNAPAPIDADPLLLKVIASARHRGKPN